MTLKAARLPMPQLLLLKHVYFFKLCDLMVSRFYSDGMQRCSHGIAAVLSTISLR